MSIDQMINDMVTAAVTEEIESALMGVVTEDNIGDALEGTGVITEVNFGDALEAAGVDPSEIVPRSEFDPDDFVRSDDLPDFDEFVREHDLDVSDTIRYEIESLLEQYSPTGSCRTARRATDALTLFLDAVLAGELDEQRAMLIDFLADPAVQDEVTKRKAEIKAERKAEAKKAKKQAKKEAKQAKADAEQVDAEQTESV